VFFCLIGCSSNPSQPSSSELNYSNQIYRGVGYDLEEAKKDAIRSALSIRIPQYVMADRIVVNSQLKRDSTISTSSGFINHFEVIDEYKKDGFVVVNALIDVSERRVKDYAAKKYEVISVNSKSDVFDGKTQKMEILSAKRRKEAEKLRKTQQYNSAVEMSERLFAGYPFNVLEAQVLGTEFDPDRPEIIKVFVRYDLNEDWRKSFWRKVTLIDEILYDSGRRNNIEICANSGSILDSCKRIPSAIDISPILNTPNHLILVPVFGPGPKNKMENCLAISIIPPIGILSEDQRELMSGADMAVGIAALGGTTVAATGALAVGIASLPFLVAGALINPESDIDYEEPNLEWNEPTARIDILGPNPLAVDFKAGSYNATYVSWRGSSDALFGNDKEATSYKPFIVSHYNHSDYIFDVDDEVKKINHTSFGNSIYRDFVYKNPSACSYGARLR
tara:strand:- start:118 stop:1464 length:1347 start_codon:yes stop_codon:yes gene_type:complete